MNDCGEVYGPCPQYSFKRTFVKIEVLQGQDPSPGWERLVALSHLKHYFLRQYDKWALNHYK